MASTCHDNTEANATRHIGRQGTSLVQCTSMASDPDWTLDYKDACAPQEHGCICNIDVHYEALMSSFHCRAAIFMSALAKPYSGGSRHSLPLVGPPPFVRACANGGVSGGNCSTVTVLIAMSVTGQLPSGPLLPWISSTTGPRMLRHCLGSDICSRSQTATIVEIWYPAAIHGKPFTNLLTLVMCTTSANPLPRSV